MTTLGATSIRPVAFAAALAAFAVGSTAHATVVSGASAAYAASVSATITLPIGPPIPISLGPIPSLSDTAPPPYNNSTSVSNITIPGILTISTLNASDSSDVDGSPGVKFATAAASIQNLSLTLPGLTILATFIGSDSLINGDFGSLTRSGFTTLTGVSVNGVSVTDMPPVNDVLLDAGGLKVVLNEQTPSGDGISESDLTVNAVDITFSDFVAGLVSLNGQIILSHSFADLAAVPSAVSEPTTLALLGAGLLGLGVIRQRKRG
ncbi:MAG: choice-of-anchor P family protein [Caldimonas sp.]